MPFLCYLYVPPYHPQSRPQHRSGWVWLFLRGPAGWSRSAWAQSSLEKRERGTGGEETLALRLISVWDCFKGRTLWLLSGRPDKTVIKSLIWIENFITSFTYWNLPLAKRKLIQEGSKFGRGYSHVLTLIRVSPYFTLNFTNFPHSMVQGFHCKNWFKCDKLFTLYQYLKALYFFSLNIFWNIKHTASR